jgi:hypothetical protein
MLKVTSDFYVAPFTSGPLAGGQKNEALKKTSNMSSQVRNMEEALKLYSVFIQNNYEKLQQVRAVFVNLLLQAVQHAELTGNGAVIAAISDLHKKAVARQAELRVVDAAQWSAFDDFAAKASAQGSPDKLVKRLKAANQLVWDLFAKLQAEQEHVMRTLQAVDASLGTNLVSQEKTFQARRAQLDEQQWAALEARVSQLLAGIQLAGGCGCADAVLGATA